MKGYVAEVDTAPGQPFTLALRFGADATAAIGAARASTAHPFGQILGSYVSGWRAYDQCRCARARTSSRPPRAARTRPGGSRRRWSP